MGCSLPAIWYFWCVKPNEQPRIEDVDSTSYFYTKIMQLCKLWVCILSIFIYYLYMYICLIIYIYICVCVCDYVCVLCSSMLWPTPFHCYMLHVGSNAPSCLLTDPTCASCQEGHRVSSLGPTGCPLINVDQFTDSASLRRAKVWQKHFSAPAPPQFQCIHHRRSAITWLQQLRLDELVEVVTTWEVRSSCKIILSIVMGVVSQLYGA